jgi:hypothetical protein
MAFLLSTCPPNRGKPIKELIAKIEQFVAAYNKTKAPFNRTATADSIMEKLQRLCSRISGIDISRRLAVDGIDQGEKGLPR